jgi:hypothetical protein
VDGVSLKAPKVPEVIAGDEVTGKSAAENGGTSTLALSAQKVAPGGLNLDWRASNVYDGYFDDLLEPGQTTSQFLDGLTQQELNSSSSSSDVSTMAWKLTDGSDLTEDYSESDVTMRPLVNVMNNLSNAYTNYGDHKTAYETTMMRDLLSVESDMRDVKSNSSSTPKGDKFLTIYY